MEKANWLRTEIGFGRGRGTATGAAFNRALVIDADVAALHAICSQLRVWSAASIEGLSDPTHAIHALSADFDLVLIDVGLPGGRALSIVEAAFARRISPTVVAMGNTPDAERVFQLAKAGVHAYIEKPVQVAQLEACLSPFDVDLAARRWLRPFVGHIGMKDIQTHVREALVREALERSGGSRRSAAQLLGVTRPAIQRWLRRA